MVDYNNLEYSLFIHKYETNHVKFSVFLLKKAVTAASTSVPITVNSKVGTTPKFYLKPPKFSLTA